MKNHKILMATCMAVMVCAWGCDDDSDAPTTTYPSCVGSSCGGNGNNGNGNGNTESDPTIVLPGCGNGVWEVGEECDDGNQISGDGCSAKCNQVETGYSCPRPGQPCVVKPNTDFCGNGIIEGNEECDDANNYDGDGCSSDCLVERTTPVNNVPVCGNNQLEQGEECDDGNLINGDGCSSICTEENGYSCLDGQCAQQGCGNGIIEPNLGEECEITETAVGTYGKGLCTQDCRWAPYCGDMVKNGNEYCDDGEGNNTAVYGSGCTEDCQRPSYCGDGVFNSGFESCDPKAPGSQNGCGEDCKAKQGWLCSAITGSCQEMASIKCDGKSVDVGEECDQMGRGCTDCRADPGYKCINSMKPCRECTSSNQCMLVAFGNGRIDPDGYEECDDGNLVNGDGCSSKGEIEPGYTCPTAGQPCIAAACGDGIIAGYEECDDKNRMSGDGCSNRCKIEEGYYCPKAGTACQKDYCGNGRVGYGEECDDSNFNGYGGCSGTCQIVIGYRCPAVGGRCVPETCGDGKINAGDSSYVGETCDDGNTYNGDGCSSGCRVEKSYHCTTVNGKSTCARGYCGDGNLDEGEECDDGNNKGGDGCTPSCKMETGYECPDNKCRPICGDGITMWMLGEACDDGNLTSGDGCSSECKIESGSTCTKFSNNYPATINLPVTFRDFIGRNRSGSGNGYVTSSLINELKQKDTDCNRTAPQKVTAGGLNAGDSYLAAGYGFPDFQGFGNRLCLGIAKEDLGPDGKPVFSGSINASCCGSLSSTECNNLTDLNGKALGTNGPSKRSIKDHLLCGASFDKWFRTDTRINQEIPGHLLMELVDSNTGKYVFDSANPPKSATNMSGNPYIMGYFNPLDGVGLGNSRELTINSKKYNVNGSFTTEVATYFQYKGGENLNFTGDDDVWVFINGKLFVDLGGMHDRLSGSNTLSNKKCSNGQVCDEHFGLYQGGVYEMRIFQTEREDSASNFKLTLSGFLNVGISECSSICGDGIVSGSEQCDVGKVSDSDALKLGCDPKTCQIKAYCGNGVIEAGETCDTGVMCNDKANKALCTQLGSSYKSDTQCDNNCKYDSCGNGVKDSWEECDYKAKQPSGVICLNTCRISKCGDGYVDTAHGEECDDGNTSDNDGCTSKCTVPRCGDGIVSEFYGETCDDGINDGRYGSCMPGCTGKAGFCGDKKTQTQYGEECDLGPEGNTNAYGTCNSQCRLAPHCGDGTVQSEYEDCDDGNNRSGDGCSATCRREIN